MINAVMVSRWQYMLPEIGLPQVKENLFNFGKEMHHDY
jgi:hypothetical protein